MESIFSGWQWGRMTVKNVVSVKTHARGARIKGHGNTQAYQLGVKFTGLSEISYGGHTVDFTPGTALYLPKESTEDIDYITVTHEEGSGVCIFFDSDVPLPKKPQILKNIGSDCEAAYMKLLNVYTKLGTFEHPDTMAAFYDLIALLYKKSDPQPPEKRNEAKFGGVIEYMERHVCDEYPNMQRMAELAGVSEKYFRDSFRRVMGVPPLAYFHKLKINRIKAMLSDLDMSISQVASICGFADANYFSRFFRKQVGISPSEYRKYYCSRL